MLHCHVDGEISPRQQHTISSQVRNLNLKDAETQTKISITLQPPADSVSAAFLTAPKLPEVFCDRNVRPCEPVSVNCPSEPEKLHCLDIMVSLKLVMDNFS